MSRHNPYMCHGGKEVEQIITCLETITYVYLLTCNELNFFFHNSNAKASSKNFHHTDSGEQYFELKSEFVGLD